MSHHTVHVRRYCIGIVCELYYFINPMKMKEYMGMAYYMTMIMIVVIEKFSMNITLKLIISRVTHYTIIA